MRCDADLLHGDAQGIADYLGVSIRTVKRWKSGQVPLPVPCRKLLSLRFDGDASGLLGQDWEGFYFQGGELFIPGWKYGFNPHQIQGMFFQVQQIRALEAHLVSLQTELLGREFVGSLFRKALQANPLCYPVSS